MRSSTSFLLALTCLLLPLTVRAEHGDDAPSGSAPSDADADSAVIDLRHLDRATVRVIAIRGVRPSSVTGSETRLGRVVAVPDASHGTGVAISGSPLVVTAAHVTAGANLVGIIATGTDTPLPARVVYVHPAHDIAVLQVSRELDDGIGLPRRMPRLTMGEVLLASGYPLDVRQRTPAAASGHLSRLNNDGVIQVSINVNPGNSGGPVVDAHGDLIGIVTSRGEPRAGVVGIAYLESLDDIRDALEEAREVLEANVHLFGDQETVAIQVVADFMWTSDEVPLHERTSLQTLRMVLEATTHREARLVVAAHAWNMVVALLEHHGAARVADLEGSDLERATWLLETARDVARESLDEAADLLVRYGIARSIVSLADALLEDAGTGQNQVASR